MPATFGAANSALYKYSVYCSYKPGATTTAILGNNAVYNLTTAVANRRAVPVTFSEAGTINSISIYHNGGTGNVLLGVYSDQSGSPSSRLGVSASTVINSTTGWQTVSLPTPVTVTTGQTVWLSWVFQNNPGIRYTTGTPGRKESTGTWSAGMPTTFGTTNYAQNKYSIYCSYTVKTILKDAMIPEVVENEPISTTFDEYENNKINDFSVENSILPSQANDFKLYPNPAKSFINVDYSDMPEQGTTIEIIDSNGRTVYKMLAESTSNRIEISQLPVGLYLIKSTNKKGKNVTKLIINK
jgi:hypothetical protein